MTDITSFEKACEKLGRSTNLPDMSSWPSSLRRPFAALYKLTVIRDAIVGDWVPDWNDEDQPKWYSWFYLNKPGFRFHDSGYGLTGSGTTGGSRLVFASREQADFAAKTFLSLYEEWMTLMPEADVSAQLSKSTANDPVNRPAHYTAGKIEVIDFIEDQKLGYHLGNSVKYISGAGKKDPSKHLEDLKKARWYLDREIEVISKTAQQ